MSLEAVTRRVWTRHPANPLLSLRPKSFDSFHIHAPMVVKDGGRYRMWYSGSDRTPNEYHRIGYAESRDGVTWERLDEPVLVPGDPSGYFSVPAVLRSADGEVLKQDGLYRMWLTGHNLMCDLRMATSPDGIEWTLHSKEPLRTDVYCPTIIFEDGVYRMWYTNLDTDGAMVIFYADSVDGLEWSMRPGPVLRSTEPWEFRNVLYPFVLKRGGVYEMYYTSYGHICELAVARSEDGIHWEKDSGPILSPDSLSSYDSLYCSNASVIPEPDGRDKLYYSSRIDMEHRYFAIALAVREPTP